MRVALRAKIFAAGGVYRKRAILAITGRLLFCSSLNDYFSLINLIIFFIQLTSGSVTGWKVRRIGWNCKASTISNKGLGAHGVEPNAPLQETVQFQLQKK